MNFTVQVLVNISVCEKYKNFGLIEIWWLLVKQFELIISRLSILFQNQTAVDLVKN